MQRIVLGKLAPAGFAHLKKSWLLTLNCGLYDLMTERADLF